MVIVGSGSGTRIIVQLEGTVVLVGIISGVTVVVVVLGTGAGSTGVEWSLVTLVEVLEGTIVVFVAVIRGSVAGLLTGTGPGTGPATTYLICSLAFLTLLSVFLYSAIT